MDVEVWLRDLGLEQYARAFRQNAVDEEVLPELSDEDLASMGVLLGHRRKLLKAIASLSQGESGAARTTEQPPAAPSPSIPEGEWRQVTVLFADLSGFSELSSELGAEQTHAVLNRYFDVVDGIVERHGGQVDKHIGDCVMGVFGAPVAHSNDAERAVRAALAIRDAMDEVGSRFARPLTVHIGVAGGQVVASRTGSRSHREYTLTGESVNLASRLTGAAPPGEILISEMVRAALARRLDCSDAGALSVKGFAEPVPAWCLRGLRETVAHEHPFVGRQDELEQFRTALTTCRARTCGRTIYLRGEAGIGKTRLVEQLRRMAGDVGFACHTGLVLDFGAGTGRDAIRALVRSLLGLDLAADLDEAQAAKNAARSNGWLRDDDVVFLNDLLDLPQPEELRRLYEAMDYQARLRGKHHTVARLVEAACRAQPRILMVEDLHWADRETLEHLAYLTATVSECPALLIMTSRSEGDPLGAAWRAHIADHSLITVDLGPLRTEEAKALAAAFHGAEREFAERCVERAAGNPLFLEQLLRFSGQAEAVVVPGSIQSLVQERMDRLESGDKAAVQAAAILGQRFELDALRYLLERPDYDPARIVSHLLVRPQGKAFLFAHALIHDGVYLSLLRSRRQMLHRRAAEWYAGRDHVLRAEHLERAESPAAAAAYLAAARVEATQYRFDHAVDLATRGLALAQEPALRHALACLRGDLLRDIGSTQESISAFEQALANAHDDAERCRAAVGVAAGLRIVDRFAEAFDLLDRAERHAAKAGLRIERAQIHHLRGNLYFPLGQGEACQKEHESALRYAREAGSPEAEVRALSGLADACYATGRMATAFRHFDDCLQLCHSKGFGQIEVAYLPMRGHARLYMNDFQGALEDGLSAAAMAARVGQARAEIIACNIIADCHVLMGDWSSLEEVSERSLTLARRIGARRFEAQPLAQQGLALAAEGRQEESLELVMRAVEVCRETGMTFIGPWILGDLAVLAQEPRIRGKALAEAERILEGGGLGHSFLWFYRNAMDASLAVGDWDEVERYAGALETYTRPEPLPWTDFFTRRGRALAAVGRDKRDQAARGELLRLRDEAERIGLKTALPAIQEALVGLH